MKSIQEYFKTAAPSPIELLNAKSAVNPAANIAPAARIVHPPYSDTVLPSSRMAHTSNWELLLSHRRPSYFSYDDYNQEKRKFLKDISRFEADDFYKLLKNNQQLSGFILEGPIDCRLDKLLDCLPGSLLKLHVKRQPLDYPFNFSKFRNITDIALNFMGLREVPASLMTLSNLWHLNLSNNEIEGDIPESICDLIKLRFLFLDDNRFTGIPECMANMRNLKYLELNNNEIDPGSLYNFLINISDEMLQNLQTLFLKNIKKPLDTEAEAIIQEAILQRLGRFYSDVSSDLNLLIDILPPQFRNADTDKTNKTAIMTAYRAYEQGQTGTFGGLMGGKKRRSRRRKKQKRSKKKHCNNL
jgi:Leucine-rich repeat (LRR) protein